MMRFDPKQQSDTEIINLDRCYAKSERQVKVSRRQQALLAAAAEDGPGKAWAIVKVAKGRENDVDKSLSTRLIEHWLPLRKADQAHHGGRAGAKTQPVWMLAWPGYLFVRIRDTAEAWHGVAAVKHTQSVLGVDGKPFFTSDDMLLRIKAELATLKDVAANAGAHFQKGEKVLVNSGPFASFPGLVEEIGEGKHEGRARVEVMIFGRTVPVDLELAQLVKSA